MDRERLRRIRNFQSQDWYPALVVRPLTILVMLVVADWRFLTPNRVTTLANLAKLAAVWIIAFELPQATGPLTWLAVALCQLGLLLDHLDGTIARYRRTFSKLGSVYDKVSDLVTWFALSLALGWAAWRHTGQPHFLVLAACTAFALDLRGYMKWLLTAETERLRWLEARADPAAAIAQRTAPIRIAEPPERTARDWLVWFARMFPRFLWFEEMDLPFWVGLGLLVGRLDVLIWFLFATQVAGLLGLLVYRHVEAARLDRAIRRLDG